MLSETEMKFVYDRAFLPEHLVPYVRAAGGSEPFLSGDYLYYFNGDAGVLVFIGYPLGKEYSHGEMRDALERAAAARRPSITALICPSEEGPGTEWSSMGSDVYFCLDLSRLVIRQKLRNTLSRAARDLTVETGRELKREHRKLIGEFFKRHRTDEETAYIFNKVPEYVAAVDSALVFSARNRKGKLAAFDVADFGSADYGFYMFNFTSRKRYVPGASDLLLAAVADECLARGKQRLNLGLGINPGVEFFKRKWGAAPLHDYHYFQRVTE